MMLQDLQAGRATLGDATLGEIVREGQRLGVKTPLTEHVLEALRAAVAQGDGPPPPSVGSARALLEAAGAKKCGAIAASRRDCRESTLRFVTGLLVIVSVVVAYWIM